MKIDQKQIVIDNLLINYYQAKTRDNEESPIVLFLHGWRSEALVWRGLMEFLCQKGIGSIALDLPAFGKSQIPKKSLTISDYSAIVSEFIQKLDLRNIVLIGHSFGGAVSIKTSLNSNVADVIKKLVLVNSSGIRLKREKTTLLLLSSKLVKPLFKPKFMQGIRRRIYKIIGNEDYLDSTYIKETYLNVIEEDISPLLGDVDKPTLLVWGDKDKDTPLWMGKKMKEEIPDSQLKILKDTGHYSFLEKPEEFKSILIDFIKY